LTNTHSPQLRLRVFAGPNGSGKSTVIERVQSTKSKNRLIDFGVYINADDIAVSLLRGGFSFASYDVSVTGKEFKTIALASGLIGGEFPADRFSRCYFIRNSTLKLKVPSENERMAQIVADFLRKKLLAEKRNSLSR
jgi:hypothetical protein